MSALLWGKVYYKDIFAGILKQEPGDQITFTYDAAYLGSGNALPLSQTLPLQEKTFLSYHDLPPFFDNLVAEGWLEQAQTRLLGRRRVSRLELLLAFGGDCAGAVSVIDPDLATTSENLLDIDNPREISLLHNRASLSGVQPKIAVIEKEGRYYPATLGETSTHIAKFHSPSQDDLLENELLTTEAFKILLPEDKVVEMNIGTVEGIPEQALIIKRFDRQNGGRIHFEEFNQLLGKYSSAKYDGDHREMSDFFSQTPKCLPVERYRLFCRIVTGFLLGNTDMHFKNFAMFHTSNGLRLTPTYDMVSAALYQYKTIALSISGAKDLRIGDLKSKHILALGRDFGVPEPAIKLFLKSLEKNFKKARGEILNSVFVASESYNKRLVEMWGKRWNGTFDLIGK